ncbi:MAG: bifunctional demethylmenaquinone methyltransferase/2-methoxy-6-polyprenyl-1,4-benzoquinol methylase UbiE [Chitinophagaceae bacterium]|nr:bifunctional demethylmenaquinone methyltransferase/2-methoxy-6-polyprenyl-1,4-benzoquinol methylase UbiE [Chitinophagaceae bacterium]MCW5904078.1 bifunctional demethylmenaquinone methyltransferase/2-methoxy-6-polyprenyl-1,4-benzoquinol methylase UbiE [Chitinophagaceae bacterium]
MKKFAHDTIVPNKQSELNKKQQIAAMFNNIAFRYDFLNRFLSLGIDISWRKKAINQLKDINPQYVLDVATGTADMPLLLYKKLHTPAIVGIDISKDMLAIGKSKIEKNKLQQYIQLQEGDSEKINFSDNTFDAVTVAFGVRNFEHLELGLQEIYRVLKMNGKLVVLEFSQPKKTMFSGLYKLYMNSIAPNFGKYFTKNKEAYQYLHSSIQAFPEGNVFLGIMENVGFKNVYLKKLSLGICTIYCGTK